MYSIPAYIRCGTYTTPEIQDCMATAQELVNDDPITMGDVIDHCITRIWNSKQTAPVWDVCIGRPL